MKYNHEQSEAAFWAKVDKSGTKLDKMESNCWEWTGATSRGYGVCHAAPGNKERLSHRRAWVFTNGDTDLCVLHKCDNRKCVRPDHMFLGTYADNNADMRNKGRGWTPFPALVGELNIKAKITAEQAAAIPERCRRGETQQSVATSLGITQSAVSMILRGKSWSHVTGIRAAK